MISPAFPRFDSADATFVTILAAGVTEIGPKSSPQGHVSPFLSLYSAPVTGRPKSQNWNLTLKDEISMKKMFAVALTLLFASSVFASDIDDSIVRWRGIAGVITAPGVDNPVGTIHAGAGPWSVRGGRASVNLASGTTSFEVEGLVLNGGNSTGTPGPVSAVIGTLVCNPGSPALAILDTTPVTLNVHGDAEFSGHLRSIPATCANPLFLVRIAAPAGAAGRWIGTGIERFIGDDEK
jgi:hypothetical protein